jgi:hypothetical protein
VSDNTIPTKRCPRCEKLLPATVDYFHRDRSMADGLTTTCAKCRSNNPNHTRKATSTAERKVKIDPSTPAGYKRCNRCEQVLPATPEYFHQDESKADGFHSICGKCRKEKNKQWCAEYPEESAAYHRKRYAEHGEQIRRNIKNSMNRHRDKRTAYERQYWNENRERRQAKSHRRKAAKLALPNTFSAADWECCLDYWGHRCAACRREPTDAVILSPDHWIALTDPRSDNPGTVPTNIVPLCNAIKGGRGGCNNSKHKREAWVWLVERFGADEAAQILVRVTAYFVTLGATGELTEISKTPQQSTLPGFGD